MSPLGKIWATQWSALNLSAPDLWDLMDPFIQSLVSLIEAKDSLATLTPHLLSYNKPI